MCWLSDPKKKDFLYWCLAGAKTADEKAETVAGNQIQGNLDPQEEFFPVARAEFGSLQQEATPLIPGW